jgi:adenylate kinase
MTSLRLLFSYLYSLVGYVCSAHLVEFRESSPSTILTTVDASSSLLLEEEFEESVNQRRTDNTMDKRKRTKGQTTIYKTLHIKLEIQ